MLIAADTPRGTAIFKAIGRRLAFDGWQRVAHPGKTEDLVLPELTQDQQVAPLCLLRLDRQRQQDQDREEEGDRG